MKKSFYYISLLLLLIPSLFGLKSFAQNNCNKSDSSFFFIQISDPQFGFFEDNKSHEKEIELYRQAISKINKLKPDFVVITGDFVNNKSNKGQIEDFKKLTKEIDKSIPVYLIPGNHDVGQQPTEKDMKNYKENYGDDKFSFSHRNSLFIGINSSFIKANMQKESEHQYKWLKKELKKSKKYNHVILFTHYPFFIRSVDEPEKYSNLSLEAREKYLPLLKNHNIRFVFAGHYHNNGYGKDGDLEMVTTSALGKPLGKAPSGLRVVIVHPTKIEHTYYALDDIPEYIGIE